ncbi:MAG: S24/S26 family peptidase [Pseudomonadota bacterium]
MLGFNLIEIRGWSMAPTLQPGQLVLFRRARPSRVRPGDIVLVRHKRLGLIVKEVASTCARGVRLRGRAACSTPKERLGPVAWSRVMGRRASR